MDTSRLLSVVEAIRADQGELEIPQKFINVLSTLQTYVATPEPPHSDSYESSLKELTEALGACRTNEFQPVRRTMMTKIGALDRTGVGLAERINQAIASAATPAAIHKNLQDLHKDFQRFAAALNALSEQFTILEIKPHKLEPNQAEIAISLPDAITKNELEEVEKQLHKWRLAVSHIQELVEGKAEPVKVTAFDTGSTVVVISVGYAVALGALTLLNLGLAAYTKVLEIRRLRRELKDQGISMKTIESIAAEENAMIKKSIEEIAEAFCNEHAKKHKKERLNELRIAVSQTLTFILKEVDRGVEVEILMPPMAVTTPAEGEAEAKPQKLPKPVIVVLEGIATRWINLKREEGPVLHLPEPDLETTGAEPTDDSKQGSAKGPRPVITSPASPPPPPAN